MNQTRQFTKRRPQSPLTTQQHSVDSLQIGVNKPTLPRSGLAIQSNAPIHVTQRSTPVHTEVHVNEHLQAPVLNPYVPAQHKKHDEAYQHTHPVHQQGHLHQHLYSDHSVHAHAHGGHDHSGHDHSGHDHSGHDHSGHDHSGHDHSGHDHSGHDHSGHDHSGHDHSGHDHSGHDHSGHDHSGHSYNHNVHSYSGHSHDHSEHSHGHSGHSHDHSGHNHDHSGHNHDHSGHSHSGHSHSGHSHNNFPQVYTPPLPSYSSILGSLGPNQQVLFTWFLGHFSIGIIVWWLGASRESLGIVGFSYLILFDSFGVLNNLVSSVLDFNPAFNTSSTKRPFGVKRFEIVFALANTIFLLFGTMYTTKESLEHLLLEGHHGSNDHHGKKSFPFGLLLMILIAISASVGSNIKLKNHENLVHLRKKSIHIQQDYSNNNLFNSVKNNMYCLSIVSTGIIVFLMQLFNITFPTLDKFLAFGESALMFYLGGPTAVALAKVLLQTMPDSLELRVDNNLRLVKQNPNVISVDKVHFWQNSYGKCIGTAEIVVRPEANEDLVLENSFNLLENLVTDNHGELTISVTKRE